MNCITGKNFFHRCFISLSFCLFFNSKTIAQNALSHFSDISGVSSHIGLSGFVVDSSISETGNKRGMLIWGAIATADRKIFLTLDEIDIKGALISRRVVPFAPLATPDDLNHFIFGQKIIKSRFSNGYYLVGNLPNNSPLIIKLENNLNPVWVKRIYGDANGTEPITFENIIESANSDLVVLGRNGRSVMVTRMSSSGSVVWSYTYQNERSIDALGASLVETTDKKICITGTIRVHPVYRAYDELFFLVIQGNGLPVRMKSLSSPDVTPEGIKIVRYGDEKGRNRFIIAGTANWHYWTEVDPVVKLVLITDINEEGVVSGTWLIGEDIRTVGITGRWDMVNDLIFRQDDEFTHTLYLTGSTRYRDSTKPFYLQLRYTGGTMRIDEYNTFFSPRSYHVGVEIKRAGANKFAILSNLVLPSPGYHWAGGVIVRDLDDPTGCILHYDQPVYTFPFTPNDYLVRYTPQNLSLGDWKMVKTYNGYSTPLCDKIHIDPSHAATTFGNPDRLTKKAGINNYATDDPITNTIRIFPNPVNDFVSIQSNEAILSASIIDASGKTIKASSNVYSRTIQLSTRELPAGTYFLKLVQKNGVSIHRIIAAK